MNWLTNAGTQILSRGEVQLSGVVHSGNRCCHNKQTIKLLVGDKLNEYERQWQKLAADSMQPVEGNQKNGACSFLGA